MRNISFSATTEQFKAGTKDVTRRMGWTCLNAGDVLMACEKCQGLGKGGKIIKFGPIEVMMVTYEPLGDIITKPTRITFGKPEVAREGFPELTPIQFCEKFIEINPKDRQGNKTTLETVITRIVFRKLRYCATNDNGFCGPHPECPADSFDDEKGINAKLCREIQDYWKSVS
jgi:hypothetical protein